MKIFHISVPKKYTKDGEEKTTWNRVGRLVYFPKSESREAGFALELSMFPDTKFGVFPDEPKKDDTPSKDEIPF